MHAKFKNIKILKFSDGNLLFLLKDVASSWSLKVIIVTSTAHANNDKQHTQQCDVKQSLFVKLQNL